MPRYFFHLRNAEKSLVDCQGTILVGADAARREAKQAVQDFCQISTGRVAAEWASWSVDVCDERGRSLFRLAFADAPQLRDAETEARREFRPVPKVADLHNVVDLTLQRRKRELASIEHETHELVRALQNAGRAKPLREQGHSSNVANLDGGSSAFAGTRGAFAASETAGRLAGSGTGID